MYEITTESHFSAAHHLNDYNGPCENVHGHNWRVKATVRCSELNRNGIGIDFKIVKKTLKAVLEKLDHHDLNEVFAAEGFNPSSENIAYWIFKQLSAEINTDINRVYRVDVYETPDNAASYLEG